MLSNLIQSTPDSRDYLFKSSSVAQPFDLRKFDSPVEDQEKTNSCVSNALVSGIESIDKERGKYVDLARLFNYKLARAELGNENKDSGTTIRDGVKAAYRYGLPPESMWPFIPAKVHDMPTPEVFNVARGHTILRYELMWDLMTTNLITPQRKAELIMQAGNKGYRVVVGGVLSVEWMEMKGVPLAQQRYTYNPSRMAGNHGMLVSACDWDRAILKNSWTPAWGDGGYGAVSTAGLQQYFEAWAVCDVGRDDDIIANYLDTVSEEVFLSVIRDTKSDPKWATFWKYAEKSGVKDKASGLDWCKLIGFDRISKLAAWV